MLNKAMIEPVHIYILLILSIGFMVHVLLHPLLLAASGRDSWICAIGTLIPLLLWTVLVYMVYKRIENKNVFSLMFQLHPFLSYVL
ncbi:hypothetical protein [Neobacillus ginsengisoli]|uniref:Uncharacterized protein n=1 Tax=Neobacillus ginsengisoli TaxID=904295 RepID=A0ABT9XZQ2_9BACI|nr:hypothetical protein [Neobacillus ginsengisoli]MDQ0201048.1 hypothetical protein [Neobacillus ginsengisoli]